jgi:TRAP-type mannitol/chloroaromatic compound transport system substrate-binding protein
MTDRRRFIVKASGVVAAAAAASSVPAVIAQPRIQWRLSTAFPPALDVLQGAAQQLARIVEETSGGRFRIEVFAGGQLMPDFACFDAAAQGTIEAFMGSGQYWHDKEPALEWFSTIPFGMNPQGMAAWYHQGDGLKLSEEAHAPFDLVPRPAPGVAPQMLGWFRNRVDAIGDFKGIKIRMGAPLGGKVIARAGGTAVLTPAAAIYAALERGVIDAAEFVGPHDDVKLGLHRTARYYYAPGWHEPGTTNEFGFNRKAYESLPADLRRTLDHAVVAVQGYGLADFHAKNAIALERLRAESRGKVEVLRLPAPVLRDLRKLAVEVTREQSEKSPMARKVHASFTQFQALLVPWDHVAEGAYHRLVAT